MTIKDLIEKLLEHDNDLRIYIHTPIEDVDFEVGREGDILRLTPDNFEDLCEP